MKVKDAKMPKSFFNGNFAADWSDLLQLQTTMVQFRGGYNCCASHCSFLFVFATLFVAVQHYWKTVCVFPKCLE